MTDRHDMCAVPFIEVFTNSHGGYRNCCAADPQINSDSGATVESWWHSEQLQKFRDQFDQGQLPLDCHTCSLAEKTQGTSFRTAVNKTVDLSNIDHTWPSRWNINFGNLCNLACWTCDEHNSSVIESHKRKIKILPEHSINNQVLFDQQWLDLKKAILNSYQHHQVVTLTVLGGEPLFNNTVLLFLAELVDLGLNKRTKLEFHTNATNMNTDISNMLSSQQWNYICIFLSIDAVGVKAEWLRYGCNWNKIEKNIEIFKKLANYVEVHCTLSVLNLNDLPALNQFCKDSDLLLKISPVTSPDFMSLQCWDSDPADLADRNSLRDHGFENYFDIVGSKIKLGSRSQMADYICQFDQIRQPLRKYDDRLADAIGLG